MDDKKKILLELISQMDEPLFLEDAEKHVEELSDEETEKLIYLYEQIRAREREIENEAKKADPKGYAKLKRKYKKDLKKLDKKFEKEKRKIESDADDELDKIEKEAKEKVDISLKEVESKVNEFEDLQDELIGKIVAGSK